MDSSSDSQGAKEKASADESFTNSPKKDSKQVSKSKDKKAGKGKAAKKQPKQKKQGKEPKQKKELKQTKQAQQPKKKKPSKSKQKGGANMERDIETVKQYFEKQNRPYNLLNVFDNLHASIKKPALQAILNNLAEAEVLTCREFGKNKVYFPNQNKFQIDEQQIEKTTLELTEAREENAQLQSRHKALTDQHRKLMAMPTLSQMLQQIQNLKGDIERLSAKKQKLMNSSSEGKLDEKIVLAAESQQLKLRRMLKKYRSMTKDAVNTWSEILEKKPIEVAEIIGIDL